MLIMVAGPYSARSEDERAANLRAMNNTAATLAAIGHIPVIGVNAALPVLEAAGLPFSHPWMMDISLALAARCDAILLIGRSPGVDREVAVLEALGRPVFTSLDEVAPASQRA